MTPPKKKTPSPDAAAQKARPEVDRPLSPEVQEDAIWCRDHRTRPYTFRASLELIRTFHGHVAPGLVIGLKMVDLARQQLPRDILFDALCETASCLPDAVQLLTPCTVGNTWLTIRDLGKFALTLYDKSNGRGCRVFLDPAKLAAWPQLYDWYYKRKSKAEQDFNGLIDDIRQAGADCLSQVQVEIAPIHLTRRSKGPIATCPVCGEAYPEKHGDLCRGCQGQTPYTRPHGSRGRTPPAEPAVETDPVEEAVGRRLRHDMA
jgi:formylmethanofuran dehydrogenase subunit E